MDKILKVFAEFHQDGKYKYRIKTLLQINGGTELLGSAVLINPGSAEPENDKFDKKIIQQFYKSNHNIKIENLYHWHEFSVDPTMRQLVKLFNGSYTNQKPIELKGIIQLFNCTYIMSPDLKLAEELYNEAANKFEFTEQDYFKNKPVYFGWGRTGKHGFVMEIALKIFDNYKGGYKKIYAPTFKENIYYHPRYINIVHNKNEAVKKLANGFFEGVKQSGNFKMEK
jgi:hypothetical protein